MHLILHFARCPPPLLVSVQKNRIYKGIYNVTGLLFGHGLKGGLLRTEYSELGVHICVLSCRSWLEAKTPRSQPTENLVLMHIYMQRAIRDGVYACINSLQRLAKPSM